MSKTYFGLTAIGGVLIAGCSDTPNTDAGEIDVPSRETPPALFAARIYGPSLDCTVGGAQGEPVTYYYRLGDGVLANSPSAASEGALYNFEGGEVWGSHLRPHDRPVARITSAMIRGGQRSSGKIDYEVQGKARTLILKHPITSRAAYVEAELLGELPTAMKGSCMISSLAALEPNA